jgi:sugar phosphate isomerase/epimerase
MMIRIASMVGAPDLESPTLAPYSGDFETAFRKLSALGYEGVEIMTKRPDRLDGSALCRLLDRYGLKLAALCTGHVFGEDQLGLVTPEVTVDPAAVARLKGFVDFAAAHFGPGTLVNIGRSRGLGDPARMEDTLACATEAMQEISDYAAPAGVRFILEPVNRQQARYVHSTLDGLDMARRVNRPNFGLMLDTYHMWLEDEDPFAALEAAAPYVWHVHFSDTNRCAPGSADFPFGRMVATLERIGFDGFGGTEIEPLPDGDSAARDSIEFLRKWIPAQKEAGGTHGF